MSCVDFMYQFYSPYFPYKSPSDDSQKYATQPLYDTGISGPGPSNFLDTPGHSHTGSHTHHNHSHSHSHNHSHSNSHAASDKDTSNSLAGDKSGPQPKSTHYLASNCVLLTYFQGEAASLVDDHFSRSLGQPSSFTLDKPAPNNKPYARSGEHSRNPFCL
ncbi:transcription cofactor vestigial-like protein 2 [Plakobranchus ocellatus]|uniref:Transcription cofactor vestigial-like protein 2 n=1 Tax=Plakobranchus ocellatus TaxID=259542 RepID=A0AAV4ALH3_9GAST|nr:transcription cofactor vestigial-like protein 2 [Plakobranchus ocellatus]